MEHVGDYKMASVISAAEMYSEYNDTIIIPQVENKYILIHFRSSLQLSRDHKYNHIQVRHGVYFGKEARLLSLFKLFYEECI